MAAKVLRRPVPGSAFSWYPCAFGIRQKQIDALNSTLTQQDPLLQKIKKKQPVKVSVTGGAGNIGYSLLFRLANGELLGPDQPVEITAIELPHAFGALKGVAMELEDCAFPLLEKLNITDNVDEGFDGCEIALLVGSKPRGPGMERADLIRDNGAIFKETGQALNKFAEKHCRVTVVGNPCNTNALIACQHAPDIPARNFTAMTRLDHDRGIGFLARKTMLPPNEINHFAIWGNHSATMFPDLSDVHCHGVPASELIGEFRFERYWRHEVCPKIQTRGARIIEVRGKSSAASAANACINHTRDWVLGSEQPDWLSMGVVSDGQMECPSRFRIFLSFYCTDGGYTVFTDEDHPNFRNWDTRAEFNL